MVRLGLGSYVSLGVVTPYTTNGDQSDTLVDIRIEGGNLNFQQETDRIEVENLDTVYSTSSLVWSGQKRGSGSISFKLTYGDVADIVRMVTGTNTTISGAVDDEWLMTAPNNSAHYFFGSTIRHIVMEVFSGDTGNLSTFYQGLVVTNAQFQFSPNDFVVCTLSFIGARITRSAKTGTTSFSTDYMATPTGQANLLFQLDGTRRVSNGVTVSIDMPLEHRYDTIDGAPSRHPLPSGKRTVSVEADIEYPDTDATLQSALDDPRASKFAGANTIQVTDAASRDMLITFGDLFLNPGGADPRPEGVGIMRASCSFVSKDDGTLPDIKFHLKADATAYRT